MDFESNDEMLRFGMSTVADYYLQDAVHLRYTAKTIATMLQGLFKQLPKGTEKHCIGLSTGAQTCGLIGKHMRLNKITGTSRR